MNSNVNLMIARVHLLSRKKQTIIAILGIMFGISMFILMVSFMQGTNNFLQDAMLSSTPDIRIYSRMNKNFSTSIADEYFNKINGVRAVSNPGSVNTKKFIKNSDGIIDDIRKNSDVVAVSPVLSSQVFFNNGPSRVNGIIDGVDINQESLVLNISGKMVEGNSGDLSKFPNGILLGSRLAENLNVHVGNMISALTELGTQARFKVLGIFQFGLGAVDNVKAIANLGNVQQLLGRQCNYVTELHIKLKDDSHPKPVAVTFAKKYGYTADDWETSNASILATVVARNVMTFVVSISVLIVAGFGIYNIMNMTIVNKLKDIAVLRAQGFNSHDISTIFLAQSVIIGLIGAIAGIILGFILSYFISQIPFPKSDIVGLKYFPVAFEVKYYVFGVLFGIITTILAGLMPSIRAANSDPLEILRN